MSPYRVEVIPLPLRIVRLLTNISLRSEQMAPLLRKRDFAMPGSDTTTKRWLPIVKE
jgi:hypothetical protein